MNNKSSLSLIGSIVLASIAKNLKLNGSKALIKPSDIPTEIEVSFEMEFPWTEYVMPHELTGEFSNELLNKSIAFQQTFSRPNISNNDFYHFLNCEVGNYGEFGGELCYQMENYPLNNLESFKDIFYYLKKIKITDDNWPSDEEVLDGAEQEIVLSVLMVIRPCSKQKITSIAEAISLLARFQYFDDYYTGNVTIDPNNKLNEKNREFLFWKKPKSELRRF